MIDLRLMYNVGAVEKGEALPGQGSLSSESPSHTNRALSLLFTQRFYTSIPPLSPHSVFNRYLLSKKLIFQIVESTAMNTAHALSIDPQSIKLIMGVHITYN